jgi:hypothetical protein
MGRQTWRLVRACAFVLAMGCGSGPGEPPVGPGADGAVRCALHSDCDDGLFCNGRETCDPTSPEADPVGCVVGRAACEAPYFCNESTDACVADCPDEDGDGHPAQHCGGDDCDDADPLRFPGNAEVCDAAGRDEDCDPTTFGDRDVDGDLQVSSACCNGTRCGPDCDDTRRGTHPGVPEVCDGLDNDCDGVIDEGLRLRLYLDADHDGIGDAAREIVACPGTPGTSAVAGDCDDTRASVRPTAPEICDGLDNDCDGVVDENTLEVPWYVDQDGDGWGIVSAAHPSIESCVPPANRAIRVGDCDDSDPLVSPTAPERCNARDDDCNGRADYMVGAGDTEDDDRDGVPDAACGAATADCNDWDPLISVASSVELCDGLDNDCDGRIDEDAAPVDWYVDMDGDGYGDPASTPVRSCAVQPGRTLDRSDCDDRDAGTYPGAVDSCAGRLGVDDDCDGLIDEGGVALTVYADLDGDGFGTGEPVRACLLSARTATRGGDCDDTDPRVSPAALDDCAGIPGVDDDCDGRIDESPTPRTFYADLDGDGWGSGAGMSGCEQPPGTATRGGDCDDASILRNPGVPDDCATQLGVDDDCDARIDEDVVLRTYYLDRDGDGFGAGTPMQGCTIPPGATSVAGDCDDDDPRRSPAAPDDCSRPMGVDDDCDGRIDEDASFVTVYRDLDGDGYGGGVGMVSCSVPLGYSTRGGDCDEGDVAIHPARPDDCTTRLMVDDDCDGTVDEDVVLRAFYPDADRDGYGTGTGVLACSAPSGHAVFGGDCDDANANRNPGRADDCTTTAGVDDDCDGLVDEAMVLTTYYRDADGDTYGDPTVTQQRCGPGSGYIARAGDCDDTRAAVRPGATEVCANGLDDDCNGLRDCADSVCASGCGTLEVLSGASQAAPVHALFAEGLRVRVRDGAGTPLSGRSVTLVTTSVSAPIMSTTTDAMGEAFFAGLRAPFRVGDETFRATALGVPDLPVTVRASTPAVGTIFPVYNGPRDTRYLGIPGPVYLASTDSPASMGGLAGASDGTIYMAVNNRIMRIRADGRIEHIAGNGSAGTASPTSDARTVAIGTGSAAIALDEPRNRLFIGIQQYISVLDLSSLSMQRYMGDGTSANSGDGGLALEAGSYGVRSISVTPTGVLFFLTGGSYGHNRTLRVIDAAGRIDTIGGCGTGPAELRLGCFFNTLTPVPGMPDSTYFSGNCVTSGSTERECILRIDSAGNLVHVAGAATGDPDAEGIDARLTVLATDVAIATAPTGEIYVTEPGTDRVRVIGTDGRIRSFAGTRNTPGDTGDHGPASAALVTDPWEPTVFGGSHLAFWQPTQRVVRAVW